MDDDELVIDTDGTIQFIYSDALAFVFDQDPLVIRRASHVEPCWNGRGWIADLSPVGGEPLGPYPTRSEALAAEVAWLRTQMAVRRLEVR